MKREYKTKLMLVKKIVAENTKTTFSAAFRVAANSGLLLIIPLDAETFATATGSLCIRVNKSKAGLEIFLDVVYLSSYQIEIALFVNVKLYSF